MTTNIPLVSIGCPVYNSEKTISRALQSLLSQTYPNIEIIISDNSSEDRTVDICNKYVEKYNRVTLSINKSNLGINKHFKIVYKKASGKSFMWAAADDFWAPEFIKTLVDELESKDKPGVAMSALKRENPDGSLKDIIRFNKKNNSGNLSRWKIARKLLSPRKNIHLQKYNLFIHGVFRYDALRNVFNIEENILNYKERALLFLISLSHRFIYVDKIMYSIRVQSKRFKARHPNDPYTKKK